MEYAAGTDVTASVKMHSGTASTPYDKPSKLLWVSSNGGTIESVKLEYGSAATIKNDPPPDYGVELAKCQRYFIRLRVSTGNVAVGICAATNIARFVITTPVSLRSNPTILYSDLSDLFVQSGSPYANVQITSIQAYSAVANSFDLAANVAGGLVVGNACIFRITNSGYLDLSSDI